MEMVGERRIAAPREKVWEALNDPDALRAAIPGCESVERTGPDGFEAKVAVKIGPMAARFGGKVRIENAVPPASYTISGEGSGGAMGFAKGGADVALEEAGDDTLLRYTVKAQVGGKIAQLGARLIDSTAKQMADQFFDRFAKNLAPVVAAPAAIEAVPGTDTEYLAQPDAPAPITQHGAGGTSPGGPAQRSVPVPAEAEAIRPLRLLLQMEPFGFPLQFWLGSAAMLVILVLLFL